MAGKLDILKKEWLDVVFKGRNKDYGAYELRQQSPRNTNMALLFGGLFFVFVLSINTIVNAIEGFIPKAPPVVKITDIKLIVPPPPPNVKKPPPPPPEPPKPKVNQVKFPPPIVKPDNQVKEPPPTVKELQTADPGQKTQKGDPTADVNIDGPVGNGDKVTEADPNQVFTAVEVEPTNPGFGAFLQKNMRYPGVDKENNVQGKVYLQFVVNTDGSVTNITVLRSPSETLSDEAIRCLKAAPKWHPGIQNGKPVRTQFTVPISFTLSSDDE
jgi:protein TonB